MMLAVGIDSHITISQLCSLVFNSFNTYETKDK